MNICLCGGQPGFLHSPMCPRPLYNCGSNEVQAAWYFDWLKLHIVRAAPLTKVHVIAAQWLRDVYKYDQPWLLAIAGALDESNMLSVSNEAKIYLEAED